MAFLQPLWGQTPDPSGPVVASHEVGTHASQAWVPCPYGEVDTYPAGHHTSPYHPGPSLAPWGREVHVEAWASSSHSWSVMPDPCSRVSVIWMSSKMEGARAPCVVGLCWPCGSGAVSPCSSLSVSGTSHAVPGTETNKMAELIDEYIKYLTIFLVLEYGTDGNLR